MRGGAVRAGYTLGSGVSSNLVDVHRQQRGRSGTSLALAIVAAILVLGCGEVHVGGLDANVASVRDIGVDDAFALRADAIPPPDALAADAQSRDAATRLDAEISDASVDAPVIDAHLPDASTWLEGGVEFEAGGPDAAASDAAPNDAFDASDASVGDDAGDAGPRTCATDCAWGCDATGCRIPISVGVGASHACALLADGRVVCWGDRANQQLGHVAASSGPNPILVPDVSGAVSLSVGGNRSCVVTADQRAICWGYNGTCSYPCYPADSGLAGVVQVEQGPLHTCFRLLDGSVRCRGYNDAGQLGDGTWTFRDVPVVVLGLPPVVDLCLGRSHACARTDDGALYCWGDGTHGALGNGLLDYEPTAVRTLVGDAVSVACGDDHTCAHLADGTTQCFGYGALGQVGDATRTSHPFPSVVPGVGIATILAAGAATIIEAHDGTVRGWGSQDCLGIGYDPARPDVLVPTELSALRHGTAFGIGLYSACAILSGAVWCWGSNSRGQLGDGTGMTSYAPVATLAP